MEKDLKSSSIFVRTEKIATMQLVFFIIENTEQLNFHQA